MMHGSTVTYSEHSAICCSVRPSSSILSIASSSACRVPLHDATVLLWPRPITPSLGWTKTQPTGTSCVSSARSASLRASPMKAWSSDSAAMHAVP